MSTTFTIYNNFKVLIASGDIQFDSQTVKAALVTSAYTPSASHVQWVDVSEHEMSGAGYSAGGATISGFSVAASGSDAKIDAYDVLWSEITADFRYVVIYISGTVGGVTNPLVGYLAETTDVEVTASPLGIQWSSDGLMTVA